jgi:biopolymer transport protein ExbB/TolQ
MNQQLLDFINNSIYGGLAIVAIMGVFMVILIVRRVAQKRFSSNAQAREFMDQVGGALDRRDFEAVKAICDTPAYWSKATPQLIQLAIENRGLTTPKLRRLVGERFERDVLADIEYRTSWISTVVKTAPMLGLLGTVMGMIAAFGKIAAMQQTGKTDPSVLAQDISFALFTTAIGLFIAIPLVLAGNMLQIRIGKLQDGVQEQLGEFLDHLAAVQGTGDKAA